METPLEKAQRIMRERRESGATITVENNLISKAKAKPDSLKRAIAAFCFTCFGGTENEMPDPGWKNDIKHCPSVKCPLYNHRPYKERSIDNNISNE